MGMAMVPEGRRLFPSLSVEENLLIGAYGRKTDGYWSLQKRSTSCFPSSRSAATIPARRFRAGSSRWSPSAAR
jgi:branched-chain amino acid transport system ATP-binding protein